MILSKFFSIYLKLAASYEYRKRQLKHSPTLFKKVASMFSYVCFYLYACLLKVLSFVCSTLKMGAEANLLNTLLSDKDHPLHAPFDTLSPYQCPIQMCKDLLEYVLRDNYLDILSRLSNNDIRNLLHHAFFYQSHHLEQGPGYSIDLKNILAVDSRFLRFFDLQFAMRHTGLENFKDHLLKLTNKEIDCDDFAEKIINPAYKPKTQTNHPQQPTAPLSVGAEPAVERELRNSARKVSFLEPAVEQNAPISQEQNLEQHIDAPGHDAIIKQRYKSFIQEQGDDINTSAQFFVLTHQPLIDLITLASEDLRLKIPQELNSSESDIRLFCLSQTRDLMAQVASMVYEQIVGRVAYDIVDVGLRSDIEYYINCIQTFALNHLIQRVHAQPSKQEQLPQVISLTDSSEEQDNQSVLLAQNKNLFLDKLERQPEKYSLTDEKIQEMTQEIANTLLKNHLKTEQQIRKFRLALKHEMGDNQNVSQEVFHRYLTQFIKAHMGAELEKFKSQCRKEENQYARFFSLASFKSFEKDLLACSGRLYECLVEFVEHALLSRELIASVIQNKKSCAPV